MRAVACGMKGFESGSAARGRGQPRRGARGPQTVSQLLPPRCSTPAAKPTPLPAMYSAPLSAAKPPPRCLPQKQALRAASQLAEADQRYQALEQALREERGRSTALEVRGGLWGNLLAAQACARAAAAAACSCCLLAAPSALLLPRPACWPLACRAQLATLPCCPTQHAPAPPCLACPCPVQAEAADALARRAEAEARYAEALEALHARQHAGGFQVGLPRGCPGAVAEGAFASWPCSAWFLPWPGAHPRAAAALSVCVCQGV